MKSSYYSIYGKQLILPPLIYLNPIKFRAPLIFALAIFVQWINSYIRALTKILFSRKSKLWLEIFSKKLCEICRNTGFLWSVFSPIWTESYSYFLMFGQNQRFGLNTGKYRYENTAQRKPVFRHITHSERTGVRC